MSVRSGNPQQRYSWVGEGVALITPQGGDPDDDAVDYHTLHWTANEEVVEQEATNTSDYDPATRLVAQRSLISAKRLSGTLMFDHNSDPATDILKNIPVGSYPHLRLYITEGNLAVTGPPAIPASNRCYFEIPEALIGPIAIEGGEATGKRSLNYTFKTNGPYTYVNEEVPPGP